MVFLNTILFKNQNIRQRFQNRFIDSVRLTVKGGHGGNGIPKFGGIGGQGGCIYFIAKNDITLKSIIKNYPTKRVMGHNGEDASKFRILGQRGEDIRIEVPMGISIYNDDDTKLIDLNDESATFLAAGGGVGGCSGTSFIGKPGQNRTLKLDLKLIADIGLVGFPNAGKSTLLKAISNALPKIASYPFTTIQPQLGIIEYEDFRQISLADLPGLIEGAHANIGLGHKFLKHVERTRLLLLVVDIFGFQLSPKHVRRNCLENVYAINKELELYNPNLLEKPTVLLVNKMDLTGSVDKFLEIENFLNNLSDGLEHCPEEIKPEKLLKFEQIIPISAKNIKEIDRVKNVLRDVLDAEAEKNLNIVDENNLCASIAERGPKVV